MITLKILECFEILKEKIEQMGDEKKLDKTIDSIKLHEDLLANDLIRTTYTLDDGMVYLFQKYDKCKICYLNKPLDMNVKSVELFAKQYQKKNNTQNSDTVKHLSFEKNWN